MPNDAKGRIDSPVELWKDVSRELWEVQLLGGGTRHMTADELDAAFARQEIHPRTPVRKQGTATWMTLREARRLEPGPHANTLAATARKAPPVPHPKKTPFQPTIEELAVVRPSSALGKIIAFAAMALVGGGIVAVMTAKATGPRSEESATTTSAANAETPDEATPQPRPEAAQALAASAASTAAIASPRDDAGTPPAERAASVTRNGAREVSGAPTDASAGIDAREANASADAGARAASEASTRATSEQAASGTPTLASANGGAKAANEASTHATGEQAASGTPTLAIADGGAKAASETATRAAADGGARVASEAATRASADGRAANEAATRASADGGARAASAAATRATVGAASRTPTRASGDGARAANGASTRAGAGGARGTAGRAAPRAAAHQQAPHATAKLEKKSERAPSKRAKASAPKKAEPKNAKPGPRAARNTTKQATLVRGGAETNAAVV